MLSALTGRSRSQSPAPKCRERVARAPAQVAAAMKHRHVGAAEPDIVEDREPRREAEFLGDKSEAQRLRVLRAAHGLAHAVDRDRAGVGRENAHQQFDQRALAGAVLAADRADFARRAAKAKRRATRARRAKLLLRPSTVRMSITPTSSSHARKCAQPHAEERCEALRRGAPLAGYRRFAHAGSPNRHHRTRSTINRCTAPATARGSPW